MDLGLGIYRRVKGIDPDVVRVVRANEVTDWYRKNKIVGAYEFPQETLVWVGMPFSVELALDLADRTDGFAVVSPTGEVVARVKTLADAEKVIAKATVNVKVALDAEVEPKGVTG